MKDVTLRVCERGGGKGGVLLLRANVDSQEVFNSLYIRYDRCNIYSVP